MQQESFTTATAKFTARIFIASAPVHPFANPQELAAFLATLDLADGATGLEQARGKFVPDDTESLSYRWDIPIDVLIAGNKQRIISRDKHGEETDVFDGEDRIILMPANRQVSILAGRGATRMLGFHDLLTTPYLLPETGFEQFTIESQTPRRVWLTRENQRLEVDTDTGLVLRQQAFYPDTQQLSRERFHFGSHTVTEHFTLPRTSVTVSYAPDGTVHHFEATVLESLDFDIEVADDAFLVAGIPGIDIVDFRPRPRLQGAGYRDGYRRIAVDLPVPDVKAYAD